MGPRITTALAVALAVVATGCGGSSGSRTPATVAKSAAQPMTRAQYVKGGNGVCLATVARSPAFPGTRAGNQFSTNSGLIVAYLQAVQNLTVQARKGIGVLRPPAELRAAHMELLAAQDARITDMGLALNAVQAKDVRALNEAIKQDNDVDAPRYTAAVKAVGLKACTRR
ncbi:MAG: hypothetical protein ACJ77Z_00205 [Thermoleophilaceae bacterium]